MTEFIKTKLLTELSPGQFLSLGFGDIVNSDADIIAISAFDEPSFVPNSSIGSVHKYVMQNTGISLESLISSEFRSQGFQIIDLSEYKLSFKKIIILLMGQSKLFRLDDREMKSQMVLNNLHTNLQKASSQLSKETEKFTIDITAMGTKFGAVRRKECFDMLIEWAGKLLEHSPKVTMLRFVAYDLDTFVDFFESLHRLKKIKPENELAFSAKFDTEKYLSFKNEIGSALKNLDDNPRSVIVTCRAIIEMIVKQILNKQTVTLADGIFQLKDKTPHTIYSYLSTCRVIGNFSNHDPKFMPTRRDAESILLLTMRIVEWYLSTKKPKV